MLKQVNQINTFHRDSREETLSKLILQ